MSLETTIIATLKAIETGTADLATPSAPTELIKRHVLASGTGSGQASKIFSDSRTLAASASEELDLAGALTSALGNSASFSTIKAIMVAARSANTNNVVVGGAASNAFLGPFGDATDTIAVKPDGTFLVVAPGTGWAVTAGTGDLLKVANSSSGSSVTYDIVVIGT